MASAQPIWIRTYLTFFFCQEAIMLNRDDNYVVSKDQAFKLSWIWVGVVCTKLLQYLLISDIIHNIPLHKQYINVWFLADSSFWPEIT